MLGWNDVKTTPQYAQPSPDFMHPHYAASLFANHDIRHQRPSEQEEMMQMGKAPFAPLIPMTNYLPGQRSG